MTNFYRRDFDNRWCEYAGPAARRPEGAVFVYCDDPRHADRRVAVKSSAVTLFGDRVPDAESVRAEISSRAADDARTDVRGRWRLECRKCRDANPVVAREPRLFAALDVLAAHGVSEVSLSLLDATIGRISTDQ